MKSTLIFAACIAIVVAAPQDDPRNAETLSYEYENEGSDGFQYKINTSNGISLSQKGTYTKTDVKGELPGEVAGSYSWTAPDGVKYTVTYNADRNGYRAVVSHEP